MEIFFKFVHFGFIYLPKDNASIRLYFFELLLIHNFSSWESDPYHFTIIFKMQHLQYKQQPPRKLSGNEGIMLKEVLEKNFNQFLEVWTQNLSLRNS